MAYDNSTGKITAPVSMNDVRQALGNSSTDLKTLCNGTSINPWAKYKPVNLDSVDTVTGQWDAANATWLTTASWWRGTRTAPTGYVCECGFKIPAVTFSSEYRRTIYYYDGTTAQNVYMAPGGVPDGVWEYEQRGVARLQDFAGYSHTNPQTPLSVIFPNTPIRMLSTTARAFLLTLAVGNYSQRTDGSNEAIFANDMEEMSGSQFCAKIVVRRYENGVLTTTNIFEVAGDSLTNTSGNKTIDVLQKLFRTSVSENPHTDMVTIYPYMRKVVSSLPTLKSLACEIVQQKTIQLIFAGQSYKMRYQIGEVTDSDLGLMFSAGFTSNLSGINFRSMVDDSSSLTETTGHWLTIGGLFCKAIINDVYGLGQLTGTFTVRVYVEDLNNDDYLLCQIPKTQILSFTATNINGTDPEGYGYMGASSSPYYHGDTTMTFADSYNEEHKTRGFGTTMIPILQPVGGSEAWPPGPLNPQNNVVAKFRVVAEVVASGITVLPVVQQGDGTYKNTDGNYNPTESMHYWTNGYNFQIIEDGEGGYEVEREPVCGISIAGLDSGEVSDNLGTAAWMPLPSGWSDSSSKWMTE